MEAFPQEKKIVPSWEKWFQFSQIVAARESVFLKSLPSQAAFPQLCPWAMANSWGTISRMSYSKANVLFISGKRDLLLFLRAGFCLISLPLPLSFKASHEITATSTFTCFNTNACAHVCNLKTPSPHTVSILFKGIF